MLGGVHLALHEHFDMDELLRHFITDMDNRGKTRASQKPLKPRWYRQLTTP